MPNTRVTTVIGALATVVVAAIPSRPLAAQAAILADCNGDSLAKRAEPEFGTLYELTPNQVWGRLVIQRTGRDFAEMGDTARAMFAALAPRTTPRICAMPVLPPRPPKPPRPPRASTSA